MYSNKHFKLVFVILIYSNVDNLITKLNLLYNYAELTNLMMFDISKGILKVGLSSFPKPKTTIHPL